MNVSSYIYFILIISILFLLIQPRISEKIYINKKLKLTADNFEMKLNTKINEVSNYGICEGKTKVEINNIISSLVSLKDNAYGLQKTKSVIMQYDALKEFKDFENKLSGIERRFSIIKEKENKVYDYLYKLERSLLDKDDASIKRRYEIIKGMVHIDIIKSYEYVQSLTQ